MPKLIFDIETIGENFDALDNVTKDTLTRWIRLESQNDEDFKVAFENLKNGMGFSPLTGEIAAIGTLDHEQEKGGVYFQAPGESIDEETEGIKLKSMSEKEILEKFWRLVELYDEFVTFNGRGFDVPFIVVRSAVHGIRPTKDLMSNRYLSMQKFGARHIDLLDQLSFYGSVRRRGNLHLWSRAFGIKSPKSQGVTGDDVQKLFESKKYKEIALYNIGDLRATRSLFEKWEKYMRF